MAAKTKRSPIESEVSNTEARLPSAGHQRYVMFEFGVGEMYRLAEFRGAIESHQHFHHADAVMKGFRRAQAAPERFHHMAVLVGIAVDAGFVLDHRHQALLGILLLDEILALRSGDRARQEHLEAGRERPKFTP